MSVELLTWKKKLQGSGSDQIDIAYLFTSAGWYCKNPWIMSARSAALFSILITPITNLHYYCYVNMIVLFILDEK